MISTGTLQGTRPLAQSQDAHDKVSKQTGRKWVLLRCPEDKLCVEGPRTTLIDQAVHRRRRPLSDLVFGTPGPGPRRTSLPEPSPSILHGESSHSSTNCSCTRRPTPVSPKLPRARTLFFSSTSHLHHGMRRQVEQERARELNPVPHEGAVSTDDSVPPLYASARTALGEEHVAGAIRNGYPANH